MKFCFLMCAVLTLAVRATVNITGLHSYSACVPSSTAASTNCTTGDVLLIGRYLIVGVHNVASLGMQTSVVSNYYNGQLSLLSDFDKNGWTSSPSPSYAGDFFTPGNPIEGMLTSIANMFALILFLGWSVEYTSDETGNMYLPNQGINELLSFEPSLIEITSEGSLISLLWVGRNDWVEVRKVIEFHETSLYLSVSVTIKNIGSTTLNDFYCKCE